MRYRTREKKERGSVEDKRKSWRGRVLEKEKEAEKKKKETGEGVEKVFEKRYKKYKIQKRGR